MATRVTKEKKALQEFFDNHLRKEENEEYNIKFASQHMCYDAIVEKVNTDSGEVVGMYVFESKIRDTHYDTLLIERKKFNNIHNHFEGVKCTLFYINFTPKLTVAFNLRSLNNAGLLVWEKEKQRSEPSSRYKMGELEEVAYVRVDNGRIVDWVYSGLRDKKIPKTEVSTEKHTTPQGHIIYGKGINEEIMLSATHSHIDKLLREGENKEDMLSKHGSDPVNLVQWLREREFNPLRPKKKSVAKKKASKKKPATKKGAKSKPKTKKK